jgi:mRNA-degrading endonuclease toxin of MazEF toxin-antitoxin module
VRKEEGESGGVVKLTSIVTLDTPDGTTKLRRHISEKVRERGERVRLMAQQKGPRVMSTTIQNNQIVLISRNIGYRRSSKIAMDQIKNTDNLGQRIRKR